MNPMQHEPVMTAAVVVPIVMWLALRFGVDMDIETATAISTAVLVIGGWMARQRVTPTTKQ